MIGFSNILKSVICLCFLLLGSSKLRAQEIEARVQVVAPRVQQSNKEILETLQNSIQQFINNRKWTEEKIDVNEKLQMSLFIEITSLNNDVFDGNAQLQVTRPVYNSSYKTPLVQFNDPNVTFNYKAFENLEYQENMNLNNLTTMLAYYVYVSLAIEFDSYADQGGSAYWSKAQSIVNLMTNQAGWNQNDGQGFRNRFYLAENFNNPRFVEYRKLNFQFHREGLDNFYDNPEKGRKTITEILEKLSEESRNNRNSLPHKLFFTTKWPELVEIYKGGTAAEKAIITRLLTDMDPTNAQRYEKIKS